MNLKLYDFGRWHIRVEGTDQVAVYVDSAEFGSMTRVGTLFLTEDAIEELRQIFGKGTSELG